MKLVSVPRILGIVLIVLSVLAYKTQGPVQVGLLAIAGAVLLLTPLQAGIKHWQAFLASWKLTKEFAFMMLFDILFWAVLAILALVLSNVLKGPVEQLKSIQLDQGLTFGSLQAGNAIFQSVFTTAIITVIIFWLLTIVAYSISRGLIWLTLHEKPLHKAFFVRFSILNLVWCTIWFLLTLFFLGTIVPRVAAFLFIVVLITYAHLTTLLHYSYVKTRSFGKAVSDAFASIGKLGSFVHPYCYLFIVYLILNQAQRVTQGTAALVTAFIIFLIFMAWYRTYYQNILRHIA